MPPIELRKDPHTHQPVIVVRFYNAGQTPALHFAAIERSDMRVAEPIHFRSRYEEIGKEGSLKGIVAIAGAGGLSRYDQTIAAESFAIVKLEKQGAEVTAFLQNLKHHKSKPNSDPPMDLIWGFFEYCDAFGVYRCDGFSYEMTPNEPHFIESQVRFPCNVPPETNPPDGFSKDTKSFYMKILPRCEQPSEMKQDQGKNPRSRPSGHTLSPRSLFVVLT
jgi:hypothetical protein